MQKYPISSYTSFWGTGKGGLEDSILGLFLRVCVSWKTKMVRQPPGLFFFYFSAGAGADVRLYSKAAAKLQLSAHETSATAISQTLEAAPAYRSQGGFKNPALCSRPCCSHHKPSTPSLPTSPSSPANQG